ncbi:PLDc N-terminal domain-containing protein, partial [Enterococcus lactis]|uniref:PLDc N-terminal domain-containing protein n=1 Tax=Enterococcus lactis TaxID=357441 RepID=UPI0031CD3D25
KPRDVAPIWAWVLVLFALPGVGFVLFLFFGRGLTYKKKFYLRPSDLKELENFQSCRGDTSAHYDPDMGDKDKQQCVDFFCSLNRIPLT